MGARSKKIKLDNVGWCERCLRPFDRPTPSHHAGSGWRVCDDCRVQRVRTKKKRKGAKATA